MFVAGAVCPHPPLLVPAVAAGAAAELSGLRDACQEAVRRLLATEPDRIVVVGDDAAATEYAAGSVGTMAPYGVEVECRLGAGTSTQRLPLSLTIGAWLLQEAGCTVPVKGFGVSNDESAAGVAEVGARLVAGTQRVAILAMGDGTARRTPAAPGYVDERAIGFDAAVAAALKTADVDALLALDPQLSRDLLAAGRASWQVLAGAAGPGCAAELLYDDAPYGVGYFVATWAP